MNAALRIAWAVVLLGGAMALAVGGRAHSRARAEADREVTAITLLAAQVRQLEALKPLSDQWASRRRPESGLAARLGEALAASGLPASTLVNVTPQPEASVATGPQASAAVRRQRASLTLAPVTLPQFGSFLDAWRQREPYWTVASIDLSQDNTQKPPEGGGDLPLRVIITLDAVYLDQNGARR